MITPHDKRGPLLEQLSIYAGHWKEEMPLVARFNSFVRDNPDCFERTLRRGHITGSGLVVDATLSKILLTHHAKLGKWLQLGGHSDGHPQVHETALRECQEESGIDELALTSILPSIFDLDIHEIPQHGEEPSHFHFDVRYLIKTSNLKFRVSSESTSLRWFSIPEARQVTEEPSMLRQLDKLEAYRAHNT